MANLNQLTIKQASEKLVAGEITSANIVKDCLEKIEKRDKDINAYLTLLSAEAKKAAEESDRRYAKGERRGPIDGLPMAIKDNIVMKEDKTTAASKILENFSSSYEATVISKLRKAGAIIIGKTNLDEFAMGSSTENSAFGPTKNPLDQSRVPGGSSGGSAAAVAADMCLGALGSDTGGSIRQPASFCGVVGFKPTYGTVSRYGLIAMASSLDQIGPITKTVEDAEILYEIIVGNDPMDSTSIKSEILNPKFQTNPKSQITNKYKIGLPKEYFGKGLNEKVKKIIEEAIEKLKKEGNEIIEISLPNLEYALPVYYHIMAVEVSSNLARYDGIKYGLSVQSKNSNLKAQNLIEVYYKSRAIGFGEEPKRRIMLGTFASKTGYIDEYYAKAQKVRTLIKKDFDQAFRKVDLILGPVSPTVAFRLGEKVDDPLQMYLSDIYTISANLAGLPALSVPAGVADGLPVGLQAIGPALSENKIFNLGKTFEGVRGELPSASL